VVDVIGSYELLSPIERPGAGPAWRARDAARNRVVALKHVPDPGMDALDQLHVDAALLVGLSHPNVVAVLELLEVDGQSWLVEEWIDGATLALVLSSRERLTPPQCIGIVRGALKGMAYAHRNRIVHGDVNPATILIDSFGTARLIDFVLASPTGAPAVATLPAYLSPEAARGLAVSTRSDVYSAAAVLAMLLRGTPPIDGPGADLSGIDDNLRSVILRALAVDPTERYADAEDLLQALEDAAERACGDDWLDNAGVADTVAVVTGVPAESLPVALPSLASDPTSWSVPIPVAAAAYTAVAPSPDPRSEPAWTQFPAPVGPPVAAPPPVAYVPPSSYLNEVPGRPAAARGRHSRAAQSPVAPWWRRWLPKP
jgi:hypothetical protein